MTPHIQLMQLIIGYACVGAFVFTVIATTLSLVGWVKFAEPKQQNKLFIVLVVEIVVVGVSFFSGLLKFNPTQVQRSIEQVKINEQSQLLQKLSVAASDLAKETKDPSAVKQLEKFSSQISQIATKASRADFRVSDLKPTDLTVK